MPATPQIPAPERLAERLADRDVLRSLAAEPLIGLGAGRALLMRLAHPRVARGVAEHSDFADRPLARLFGTLDFLLIVTFGTPEEVGRCSACSRRRCCPSRYARGSGCRGRTTATARRICCCGRPPACTS